MTKKICRESQCPLAAKLIRTNGLHAYINTWTGSFPIILKNFTKRNIESTSKVKKTIFIDTKEWENNSATANIINVRGGYIVVRCLCPIPEKNLSLSCSRFEDSGG
ncbi:MAG: hypothetical protein NUV74_11730 [Candidatus Brocadiaceae bacterium]|nr:hypothetical protein [Candidatus Brocadiaceae bacterium]